MWLQAARWRVSEDLQRSVPAQVQSRKPGWAAWNILRQSDTVWSSYECYHPIFWHRAPATSFLLLMGGTIVLSLLLILFRVQTALCFQYDHDMFQMFQFAVRKSWGCQLLRKRMIHIAGSQPNYVTEPSRAAEAMCTVTSRECLDLLKRESFPVLMHNLMILGFDRGAA